MREKKASKRKRIFGIGMIISMVFVISWTTTVFAAKSNSYSLVVSGAGLWNGDKDEMVKILQANKLFSKNSVYTFTYDTDTGGTRKMSYQNAIDTAYSECTINDTAFFFHSGHGMEGFTKGMGLLLKNVPPTWYGYEDLLNKLGNVRCKHMVVIIHACESGAVKRVYDKLPESKRNKISLFWSSKENQPSYKNEGISLSVYGQSVVQMMGYNGEIGGDINGDGILTVKELGDSIEGYIDHVSEYHKVPKAEYQIPGYCSAKNLNTPIYSLKNVSSETSRIAAPKIKSVDASKQNKITISWNKVDGADGYIIYTSEKENGKYKKIKNAGKNARKVTIKVGNGKTVYIKLRSMKKKKTGCIYSDYSSAWKAVEVGAVWYKKVLQSRNASYDVRAQFNQNVQKRKVNRRDFPYYQVVDINKDGIKELILHSDLGSFYDENNILLLTYYKDKVKPLLYTGGSGKRGAFYISGKNLVVKMGGSDFSYLGYFSIKNGKLAVTRQLEHDVKKSSLKYRNIYYFNRRKITSKKYDSLIKKYSVNERKKIAFQRI